MRIPAAPVAIVWTATAASSALAPLVALATDYMSAAEAQKLMFPAATAFVARPVQLSPDQVQAIKARAGGRPVGSSVRVSAALDGERLLGFVVTDSVIGKVELIDYAVALGPHGEILDVEILSYRESHGGEVRTAAWRRQFVGKSASAALTLGDDIANISGATLSCTHLTDGVRRIAALTQIALVPS